MPSLVNSWVMPIFLPTRPVRFNAISEKLLRTAWVFERSDQKSAPVIGRLPGGCRDTLPGDCQVITISW
jgi:hypothetical protein